MATDGCPKKKLRTHICPVCGTVFKGSQYKIYCSVKCRQNHANAKLADELKALKSAEQKHRDSTIIAVNSAARAAGLTYGQYKAREYAKGIAPIKVEGKRDD